MHIDFIAYRHEIITYLSDELFQWLSTFGTEQQLTVTSCRGYNKDITIETGTHIIRIEMNDTGNLNIFSHCLVRTATSESVGEISSTEISVANPLYTEYIKDLMLNTISVLHAE